MVLIGRINNESCSWKHCINQYNKFSPLLNKTIDTISSKRKLIAPQLNNTSFLKDITYEEKYTIKNQSSIIEKVKNLTKDDSTKKSKEESGDIISRKIRIYPKNTEYLDKLFNYDRLLYNKTLSFIKEYNAEAYKLYDKNMTELNTLINTKKELIEKLKNNKNYNEDDYIYWEIILNNSVKYEKEKLKKSLKFPKLSEIRKELIHNSSTLLKKYPILKEETVYDFRDNSIQKCLNNYTSNFAKNNKFDIKFRSKKNDSRKNTSIEIPSKYYNTTGKDWWKGVMDYRTMECCDKNLDILPNSITQTTKESIDETKKLMDDISKNIDSLQEKLKKEYSNTLEKDINKLNKLKIKYNSYILQNRKYRKDKKYNKLPSKINHTCRILRTANREYYIVYVFDKSDILEEDTSIDNVISIDPGVRRFITGFDINENSIVELDYEDKYKDKLIKLNKSINQLKILIDNSSKTDNTLNTLNTSNKREIKHKLRNKLKKVYFNKLNKLDNIVTNMHRNFAKYLCKNYSNIIIPKLNFHTMDKLNKTSKKELINYSQCKFVDWLITKAKQFTNCKVIVANESYTTLVCSFCGHTNEKYTSKILDCSNCKIKADRDFNSARNILYKTIC